MITLSSRSGARGDVPVTRRMLSANPRRFGASIIGVGLALMLVLLIQGLSAGVDARVTIYETKSGAALFVAQPGTASLLGANSVLPKATLDRVKAEPTVLWAAPMRGFFTVPDVAGTKIPSYVVGWEPGQPGGPWDIPEGRAPAGEREVAVGPQFAGRAGLRLGDTLELVGRPFTVVGIAADADMFMASFVFMTHAAADSLLGTPTVTSFVLVGTDHPDQTQQKLVASGLHVLTRDQIMQADLKLKGQTYGLALATMVLLACGVGTVVIALAIYSAIMDQHRDYGIMKALGSSNRRLFRLAGAQSVSLAMVGLILGGLFFAGAAGLIGVMRPQFAIVLTPGIMGRTMGLAVFMGVAATVVPARHLAAMDPAAAFRGG